LKGLCPSNALSYGLKEKKTLKRGWTKFSLSISLLAGFVLPSALALPQGNRTRQRTNELTLAGLRPGRDALENALKRYRDRYLSSDRAASEMKQWLDACTGRALSLELDAKAVIQGITVSSLVPPGGKCEDRRFAALAVSGWVTGRGLRLGDPQHRVVELYGEPDSTGPSIKGDRELEFMYYAFDWAGSDVPQVLQIHCARESGRVVEMTLAFPSL
jgi:hypothetical protein